MITSRQFSTFAISTSITSLIIFVIYIFKWKRTVKLIVDCSTSQPDTSLIHKYPLLKINSQYTFNHYQQFIIQDGFIFFKRFEDTEWKRIVPPFSPKEIICDGTNLVVLDDTGRLNYIKAISESRKKRIYYCEQIIEEQKWKDSIWGLPMYRNTNGEPIVNTSEALWAISHKGLYQWFYQVPFLSDGICAASPKKYYEWKFASCSGVTSFYFCKIGDDRVTYMDPLGSGEGNTKPVPEGKIFALSASASNVCVLTRLEDNSVKCFTISVDYDLSGHNMLYRILRKDTINKEKWYEQTLPTTEPITNITMAQGKNGNFNCDMIFATENDVYVKKLYQTVWTKK